MRQWILMYAFILVAVWFSFRRGLKCQILSNQDKIASLFQDSERTSASTETNNTSYESPDIQLFGARRMRAWHHHGGATPTSRKTVYYFYY